MLAPEMMSRFVSLRLVYYSVFLLAVALFVLPLVARQHHLSRMRGWPYRSSASARMSSVGLAVPVVPSF